MRRLPTTRGFFGRILHAAHSLRGSGLLAAACLISAAAMQAHAQAQPFPSRPIRLVVPYAAASSADTLARQIGPRLAQLLGQPVIVDNKPGGGAIIGTQFVAQAAPDGYTLLLGTGGTHAINKYLFKDLPYDPVTSFSPVARIAAQANVLLVASNSQFRTVQDLVAYAKANPGKLSYGSIGVGSTVHLAGEMFNSEAGTRIVHIPYKSAAQELPGLFAGDIAMMFYPYGSVASQIQSGAVRALAHSGRGGVSGARAHRLARRVCAGQRAACRGQHLAPGLCEDPGGPAAAANLEPWRNRRLPCGAGRVCALHA